MLFSEEERPTGNIIVSYVLTFSSLESRRDDKNFLKKIITCISHVYSVFTFFTSDFCIYYYIVFTAVEQVVACALVTQRARVRSPVGTSFLGEVFSGVFLTCKTNVGKL